MSCDSGVRLPSSALSASQVPTVKFSQITSVVISLPSLLSLFYNHYCDHHVILGHVIFFNAFAVTLLSLVLSSTSTALIKNKIKMFLIYKDIQTGAVEKSYNLRPSNILLNICTFPHVLGSPFLINDYATAPF